MNSKSPALRKLASCSALSFFYALSIAQTNPLGEEAYLLPPKPILELAMAPRSNSVVLSNLSPDGSTFLISKTTNVPSIADLSRHAYNLGGLRIDPRANRSRAMSVRSGLGYTLYDWRTKTSKPVTVPKGIEVSGAEWSPDGKKLAFFGHADNATNIYIADISTGVAKKVTDAPLLATQVTSLNWTGDGKHIVAVFLPDGRGKEPTAPEAPTQPVVRVTNGRAQNRTFASLLSDPTDQAKLEYFITGQLGRVDISNGKITKIGKPAMIRSVNVSPDGRYFRVTTMLKPFSYTVPVSSFGSLEELWDESGKALSELSKRELRTGDPDDPTPPPANPNDKRSLSWRPDGKGMSFLQQAPAQQGQTGPRKDRLMLWKAPFGKDDVEVVYESDTRMGSVRYSPDCQILFITEGGGGGGGGRGGGGGAPGGGGGQAGAGGGTETLYAVKLSNPTEKIRIYQKRSDEFLNDPGNLMMTSVANEQPVVRMSPTGGVFLSGTQYYEDPLKEAPRPFVDEVPLGGEKKRIWQSPADTYDTVAAVLEPDMSKVVITRQSRTQVPQSHMASLPGSIEAEPIFKNIDYTAEITNSPTHRVQITRPDGIKFWATVTMPRFHIKGSRVPAMFWFYPREYTDQAAYNRTVRNYNKNDYPNMGLRSMQYLTVLGYAVVEPDCPIIGPTGRMNDRYIPDLRNNLAATIDELDRQGLIDRTRLAIGGHSYGAFSAANAMVHTPFFKAGIAGDGNYNRLLTPMAFQSERRILWDARETYLNMSPLLFAEQMTGAFLMYHGMDDQNVGTDPINSWRMYHALEGLGKPAALYMYPFEDHGPVARETQLDMWARWVAWLDKYVMKAK